MNKIALLFVLLWSITACNSQSDPNQQAIDAAKVAQHKLNLQYADKEESPLTDVDFKDFRSLEFYPVAIKYVITAKFVRNENPVPFELSTTTDRKPIYQKYGTLFFTLDNIACELPIYQNVDALKEGKYLNHIFVPFTDLTTGGESYGGGRYVDLELPFSNEVVIDFNRAYNPYCAYNHKYSCAIPPEENHLNVAIKAGVKAFANH